MLGWELPPHHTGGMGIVCYQMCKELARKGADIEFILPYSAEFPDITFMKINTAIPEHVSKVIGQAAGSTYDSQYFEYVSANGTSRGVTMNEHQSVYASYFSKLVQYGSYDVIHAHDWLTLRAGLQAKQVSGLPLFVHVHATEYDRSGGGFGNPLVHEIEYIGFNLADRIFAISQITKDTIIREYGVDPAKITVVHNAMELQPDEMYEDTSSTTFRYLVQAKAAGYGVVLSAGRLTLQKNLVGLLRAFQKVVSLRPRSILLMVGSGEQYHELIELSADLGIAGNVIFTGRINGTGKAWRDAFRVANLFVMPSTSEPFGLTPFEAIFQDTPALISKQSGASEILHHALKTDHWDIDGIANKIIAVLDHKDLEVTLAANGKQELTNFNWSNTANKILEQYRHHALPKTKEIHYA